MPCGPNSAPSGRFLMFPDSIGLPRPFGLSLWVCGGGNALINFNGAPKSPGIIYSVKASTAKANDNLPTEILGSGLSCGKVIFPKRYNPQTQKMIIQIERKSS